MVHQLPIRVHRQHGGLSGLDTGIAQGGDQRRIPGIDGDDRRAGRDRSVAKKRYGRRQEVAPRVGAWIEIISLCRVGASFGSPLAWGVDRNVNMNRDQADAVDRNNYTAFNVAAAVRNPSREGVDRTSK